MLKLVKTRNGHVSEICGLTSILQAKSMAVIENDQSVICEFEIYDKFGPLYFGIANRGPIEWVEA